MTTLHFSITIGAARDTVWRVLIGDFCFREWSSDFAAGTYAEGDWAEDARMQFLARVGDGMVSVVAESRPAEFLSIEHIGEVNQSGEDTDSDAVLEWAPAYENCTLDKAEGGTELIVDMDVPPEYLDFFAATWPAALDSIKRIAEDATLGTAVPSPL